jgi:hypothetical protein
MFAVGTGFQPGKREGHPASSPERRCSASTHELVERLSHEIRCLEAIDAGLQGLPHIDMTGHEPDFARLVQDRIDRLREIMEELEGGDHEAATTPSVPSPTASRPAWMQRAAMQIASQLPIERDAAREVLEITRELVATMHREPAKGAS